MPIMIGLLIFVFIGALLFFFFFAIWAAWYINRILQQRKQKRAHRLATYLRRIKPVVAELLHQANELDQASKYSGLDRDPRWAKKYGDALNQLLSANAKLEEANVALVEQELNAAQDCLLYILRTVHVVSYRMKEMEPVEQIIELKVELQIEHQRAERSTHEDARAANASGGVTNHSSKSADSHHNDGGKSGQSTQKADEQHVLKINDRKKESLRDEGGKH